MKLGAISNTMAMLKDKDNLYIDDSGLDPHGTVRTRARKLAPWIEVVLALSWLTNLQLIACSQFKWQPNLEIAEISTLHLGLG